MLTSETDSYDGFSRPSIGNCDAILQALGVSRCYIIVKSTETSSFLMGYKATYDPCRRPWSAIGSGYSERRSQVHCDRETWASTVPG